MSALELPPLPPLRDALARLDRVGIPHALGGSALLAALGLIGRVNDWDVTCDADLATLRETFADRQVQEFGNSGIHADHKLNLEGGGIELIARFAFFVDGRVVRIPTRITATWRDLPVGSPESWYVAYWLMGELEDDDRRRDRAARLFAHLEAHGAEGETLRALLAEPLPDALAARLLALSAR